MKPNLRLHPMRILCALALGMGSGFDLVAAVDDAAFRDANWSSMGGVPGANGPVHATAVDDSGNLYLGGTFSVAGEAIANNKISCRQDSSLVSSGLARIAPPLSPLGAISRLGFWLEATLVPDNESDHWEASRPEPLPYGATRLAARK